MDLFVYKVNHVVRLTFSLLVSLCLCTDLLSFYKPLDFCTSSASGIFKTSALVLCLLLGGVGSIKLAGHSTLNSLLAFEMRFSWISLVFGCPSSYSLRRGMKP